jgi:hypothetical protein
VKDVENRPRRTHHRGPLLIHAGLNLDGYAESIEWVERKHGISVPFELETGGIVGVVDVIDLRRKPQVKMVQEGKLRLGHGKSTSPEVPSL